MSASFTTGNWETISSSVRFSALLGFFLILIFRIPLSERLRILLFKGHEERVDKKTLLSTSRASVSNCLQRLDQFDASNNANLNSPYQIPQSVSNEISYLSLRRQLNHEHMQTIDKLSEEQRNLSLPDGKYFTIERIKIGIFSAEIDRLSNEWNINV